MACTRRIFERTGILDEKDHIALPPGGGRGGGGPQALPQVLDAEVVEAGQKALPVGKGEEPQDGKQDGKQNGEPPVA